MALDDYRIILNDRLNNLLNFQEIHLNTFCINFYFLDYYSEKSYNRLNISKLKVSVTIMMIIFPIVIVISIVLYIYYKVSILRTKDGLTQLYFNAKSRICLGTFIIFFGINQYLYYQSKFALIISLVFLLLGV